MKFIFKTQISFIESNDTYLRIKIRVVWGGNFSLKCISIEFTIPNQSLFNFFKSENFKTMRLKLFLDFKITY